MAAAAGFLSCETRHKQSSFSAFEQRPIIDMRYRHAKAKGSTFFSTVVTAFKGMKLSTKQYNVGLLRESLKHVIQSHRLKIDALVLGTIRIAVHLDTSNRRR